MKLPSLYLRPSLLMASLVIQLITVVVASGGGSGTTSSTAAAAAAPTKKYNAMFTFGDSMDETGNICVGSSNKTELNVLTCTHPPYGETYFGRPSCRWCDGRVVVDFVGCKGYVRKSLFMFGAYGGNDYNVQLLERGLTPEQAMNYTPKIVGAIANGVVKLIALGAVHVVVPGIFPTGCLPIFLSLFGDGDADLDDAGCLKAYNLLTKYHNSMLRKQVEALQRRHRNSTRLMYADYYGLVYQMVQEPHKFGFSAPFEACCGAGGGKYNFDLSARCGMDGATVACRDSSARLSWDGIHPTEAANKVIAGALLRGPYCTPPILS
ncbi:hypothetical protein CFC21_079200 [Triticum aestivum]|uniref:GDSL esterase/lipase n=2 Tax=Triticum aestivum TaxID=4565 RepID=A0A3B6MWU3_WHEAT|nr:GDSL esterase/lipase At1g28600-like isoform X1 [Triticum aestivum]KAF7074302.1 hypothetical protein CFC21_079200 [Triticum aestivum]